MPLIFRQVSFEPGKFFSQFFQLENAFRLSCEKVEEFHGYKQ